MMTSEIPTAEQVQHTLQEYLRIADETGELRGTKREFTADGVTWHAVLFEGLRPVAARATVTREGHEPTVITVLWDESVPVGDEWLEAWEAKPHVRFGAFALRASLRTAFPAALGDRREPDDFTDVGTTAHTSDVVAAEPAAPVDWLGELAAATTVTDIDTLYARAGKARVEPATFLAIQRRLREMKAEEADAVASAGTVTAEQAAAAFSPVQEPEPIGEISEQEWLVRIGMAASDEAIDEIRHTLRAQPDGVTEAQHAALKRRTRELASAPLTNAVALAMRDGVAKASGKPTPLTVAARGARP